LEALVSFDVSSFNWIAIVFAGVAAWIVGAIWFSPPVFGKRWMAALNITQTGNPAPAFVGALVIAIIGAIVLRWVLGIANATNAVEGIEVALLIWFAFIMLTSLPSILFAKGSRAVFAIVQGQHVVAMIVMAIILTTVR
jgi:hypothetical protein